MVNENGVHMLKIHKPKIGDIGSYTCEGNGKAVTDFRVASEFELTNLFSEDEAV